ncbi:MAG: HAD-IC family P-type ATPase [Candidatus Kapabacteria bacterium]|nr:HAD-IC family P-type ATPase [Candidatus Kapabacteria bacterium]
MSSSPHLVTCFHCGTESGIGAPAADGHTFCCQGCLSVYDLLRTHDSCQYYQFDDSQRRRPAAEPEDRFTGLDRAFATTASPGIAVRSTIHLRLPDMHCAGCVWLLERLSRFDSGILASRVDLLHQTVVVDYNNDETSPSAIARLLDSLGYPPAIGNIAAEGRNPSSARRTLTTQIGIAGFAAGNVMMIGLANYIAGPGGLDPLVQKVLTVVEIGLSALVLVTCTQPWLRAAWGSLRRGVVSLDVPVSIGILTIFSRSLFDILTGRGEGFLDSFTGLVFFLLVGRLFQQRAFESLEFERSMHSFLPITAMRRNGNDVETIGIDELQRADVVVVRNGEVIPADAILLHTVGVVDYAYLTGEVEPIECRPGTMLYAGGRVLGRALELSVVKPSSSSMMASLWSRQDIHTDRRSIESTRERFGLAFTASVLGVAIGAAMWWLPNMDMALNAFTSVMIIACPCALTLAMPITFGTAMGVLSRRGIFLKNVATLSELQRVTHVTFDKTGTLTRPHTATYVGAQLSPDITAGLVALAMHSTHPVSRAIVAAGPPSRVFVDDVQELPGVGIRCNHAGHDLALGSAEMILDDDERAPYREGVSGSVAMIDGHPVGRFVVRHEVYSGVASMVSALRQEGISVSMVSGDSENGRTAVEHIFRPEEIRLSTSPSEKVENIMLTKQSGKHVLMVGDGLNDIAAMSAANVSIAVSNGSSRIVPACDVMIDAANISTIDRLLSYAKAQKSVVTTAFWFTMAYNALGFYLAVSGRLSPVITAVMMPLSSLLVIAISVLGAQLTYRRITWE